MNPQIYFDNVIRSSTGFLRWAGGGGGSMTGQEKTSEEQQKTIFFNEVRKNMNSSEKNNC